LTSSTLTTVAIFREYSIFDKNENENSPQLSRKLKYYIGSILIFSLLFNLPLFFEATWEEDLDFGGHYKAIAPLRMDPSYVIYYRCWTRLFFIRLVPLTMMVFYGLKAIGNQPGHVIYNQHQRKFNFILNVAFFGTGLQTWI
jgi:hypothetical protein